MRDFLTRAFVLSMVAFIIMTCGNNGRTTVSRPIVIIFADVTSTITETEHRSIATLLTCIIKSAPSRARVVALPISLNVQQAELLAPIWTVPSITAVGGRLRVKREATKIADIAVTRLGTLYGEVTNRKGAVKERTCIFEALRRAESIIAEYSEGPIHIYVISDLVEDCRSSYNDQVVRLNKLDIKSEVDAARRVERDLLNLRGATVTFLLPRSDEAMTRKDPRPSSTQRRHFWEAVLDHCNASVKFNPTIEAACAEPTAGGR
jgi:hypothetical protein